MRRYHYHSSATVLTALLIAVTASLSVVVTAQPMPPAPSIPTPSVSAIAPVPIADRPKIAVYVFGAEDPAINKAMATRLIAELANTGRYQTADNYREFFDRVTAEPKGAAGIISSKQMAVLGKRFGMEYVCVAEFITAFGARQVSAHILGVNDGGILAMGGGSAVIRTFADLTVAAEQIVNAMFWGADPPGSAWAPPVSAAGSMLAGTNTGVAEFTDFRDGKIYKTITVGGVAWMAQNLNYVVPVGSWCYNNDNSNCNAYGRLYDWNAAGAACPSGWYLPSRLEWNDLVATTGGSAAAGQKLKSITDWNLGSSGLDDYGFSALPGGSRDVGGKFAGINGGGYWWTSTPDTTGSAYYRHISHDRSDVDERSGNANQGISVRCVQR